MYIKWYIILKVYIDIYGYIVLYIYGDVCVYSIDHYVMVGEKKKNKVLYDITWLYTIK